MTKGREKARKCHRVVSTGEREIFRGKTKMKAVVGKRDQIRTAGREVSPWLIGD
jgi:hypothetical protein